MICTLETENVKTMKTKKSKPKASTANWREKPRTTNKQEINVSWLLHRMDQKGMNKTELCRGIGIRNDLLSRVLKGQRRLQIPELERMAVALDLPHDELLTNLGLKKPETMPTPHLRTIAVDAWLDGQLQLRQANDTAGGIKGPKTAVCPFAADRDLRVARVQSVGSENDGLDGALVYYRATASAAELGRLGLVELKDRIVLRVVRRSYVAGRYNLTTLGGKLTDEGESIVGVHPVLWIKF